MISFSSVLSRGLLNRSLNVASLIRQLLGVLGMLVALPGASVAAVPAGGTSSRSWAMGCHAEFGVLQGWN